MMTIMIRLNDEDQVVNDDNRVDDHSDDDDYHKNDDEEEHKYQLYNYSSSYMISSNHQESQVTWYHQISPSLPGTHRFNLTKYHYAGPQPYPNREYLSWRLTKISMP